jgi:hypothetical protein
MKAKYYPLNANLGFIRLAILFAVFLFQEVPHCLAQSKESGPPLESFEGFYRFPNQVAYVKIVQKGDKLIGTQLWDKKDYELVRKSDLSFEAVKEGYPVKFIMDNGKVKALFINNWIEVTRVNYDPEQKQTLRIEWLKKLEGRYQFQKDAKKILEISVEKDGLVLKSLWDQKALLFYARSEVDFYNEKQSFPLHFILENDQPKQLICFGTDKWNKLN